MEIVEYSEVYLRLCAVVRGRLFGVPEKSVAARKGFSKTEKNKMLLSDATRSGLKFTGTGVCMYVCVCVCVHACVRMCVHITLCV